VSEHPTEHSLGGFAARGYARLPGHIEQLSAAVSDAERSLASAMDRSERVREGIGLIAGHGEAERGAVKVTVDAAGRLVDIDFTAGVFRLASIERLRDAIKDATDDAVDDAATQYRQLAGVGTDGIPDPMAGFLGAMPEVTSMLPDELLSRLRGESGVDAQDRTARRRIREIWEGPNPYEP
jgi:DNA-binding protein YbaB